MGLIKNNDKFNAVFQMHMLRDEQRNMLFRFIKKYVLISKKKSRSTFILWLNFKFYVNPVKNKVFQGRAKRSYDRIR